MASDASSVAIDEGMLIHKAVSEPSDISLPEPKHDPSATMLEVENEVAPNPDQKPSSEGGAPIEFNPDRNFYLAFFSLATLTAVVALDGTTPAVALPVSSSN